MLYNVRQSYTPPLEPHEFNSRALIIDTETVGSGAQIEVIEVAVCDSEGRIVLDTLVRPLYNSLPRSSKEQRFGRAEFASAPYWTDVWPGLSALIDNKLLVAYNAAFDQRALAAMCARHRQTSTEWGWRCAMQLAKRVCGSKKSLTLSEACARHGLVGGNHRAARDVLATYALLKCLLAACANLSSRSVDRGSGR